MPSRGSHRYRLRPGVSVRLMDAQARRFGLSPLEAEPEGAEVDGGLLSDPEPAPEPAAVKRQPRGQTQRLA